MTTSSYDPTTNHLQAPPTIQPGRSLGGFVLLSEIGAGAMGIVFRAKDQRLNRHVAVKILPSRYAADDSMRQRFLREGRTAASIDHPNVVRIIAAGEEDSVPFLVMELMEGGTLEMLLRKRDLLPPGRCLRIGRQLAEALAAAHGSGVVHRDVKPANVLFTREGEPKLADFGLAQERSSQPGQSQHGMIMGTPFYMAPEVCEGKVGDLRSDIYSLGVVLYQMISGRLPFLGDSHTDVMIAHLQRPVPPIPEAPGPVAEVVLKALEKNPADRWTCAAELAGALEQVFEAIYSPAVPAEAGPVVSNSARTPAAETQVLPSPPVLLPRRRQRVRMAATAGLLTLAAFSILAARPRTESDAPPATPPGPVAAASPATQNEPSADFVAVAPDSGPLASPPALPSIDADPWLAELERAAARSDELEAKDDFLGAMAAWSGLQPPDEATKATVQRRSLELESRAILRARKELKAAGSGVAAARRLRALAATMPVEAAELLTAAAAEAEARWAPADGLAALRGLLATRDLAGLEAILDGAGEGETSDDRATVDSLRRAVTRLRLALDRALAWYGAREGKPVEIERADGSVVKGTLLAIDAARRQVHVKAPSGLLILSPADLSCAEIAARALDGVPPDEAILAVLDVALWSGRAAEAWPLARSARIRGLVLDADRADMLASQVPEADRLAAAAGLRDLEAASDDPERVRDAARAWLRDFRGHPLPPESLDRARAALCAAAGPATAEDLTLFSAARVSGKDRQFSLLYDSPDSLLADFASTARFAVESADAPALRPAGTPNPQLLRGLDWRDGVLEMEVRIASEITLIIGHRAPAERFLVRLQSTEDGRARITLPSGDFFYAPLQAGGWIHFRAAWGPRRLTVQANRASAECSLPHDWYGEIGFLAPDAWAFRFIKVFGRADFAPPPAPALPPLRVLRAVPTCWGRWLAPTTRDESLTLEGGEGYAWATCGFWEGGSDYRMAFRVSRSAGATIAIDIGGQLRRRIELGEEARNGFVSGAEFLDAGAGVELGGEEELEVALRISGDRVRIDIGGREVWQGSLSATAKGVTVGVRRGTATFSALTLEEIEK